MITFFRRWANSVPALILLGLILVAFAVTGVGDPFGAPVATGTTLAKLGDRTLTETDLQSAFERAVQSARAQNPNINQVELAKQGAVATIADQLIGTTAIEEVARQAGLSASDRAVGAEIAAIPAFQTAGKFDETVYRQRLAESRLSDKDLRDGITSDLLRRQLITPATTALTMPKAMADAYAHLFTDAHVGAIAQVPLPAATASEAEIIAFYNANKARFTQPERRAFRWAEIDRGAVAAGVTVSEAAIAAAFAKDPAKYGAAPTRVLEQAVVQDAAQAKAIAAAAGTEGFAAAAKRIAGLAPADLAVGSRDQAGFARDTSTAVAAAAFALPTGGTTQPVQTDFGWHVVHVVSLGSSGKSLAEARAQVATDLKQQAVDKAVSDLVARIEEGLEDGKSFADIARDANLAINVQAALTEAGAPAGGAADPALAPIAALAFRHEPGETAAVEEIKPTGRLVVIETSQVVPAAPPPLAAIRADVARAAGREKALKQAKATADAIIAATAKSGDFAAAVRAAGLPAPSPARASRFDLANNRNAPAVLQGLVTVPPGTTRAFPTARGWVLIRVDRVEPTPATTDPEVLDQVRQELASSLPEEFGQGLARAAERSLKTNRNPKVIADLTTRLSGGGTEP